MGPRRPGSQLEAPDLPAASVTSAPNETPIAHSTRVRLRMEERTRTGCAPSAIRRPISRVRRATAEAIRANRPVACITDTAGAKQRRSRLPFLLIYLTMRETASTRPDIADQHEGLPLLREYSAGTHRSRSFRKTRGGAFYVRCPCIVAEVSFVNARQTSEGVLATHR
jgi:hypothetical protein